MKITSDKIKNNFYFLFCLLLFLIIYFITGNPIVFFVMNMITLVFTIVKAKLSYFSIKTLIVNYILFAVLFQYSTGESYGILQFTSIPLNFLEINGYILIYNVLCYLWLINSNILEKEKELLQYQPKVSLDACYACCAIAIFTAIIAFPYLPFSTDYLDNRFVALLPGKAWNHISMVALLFAYPKLKESRVVKASYLFVIFWFLSHYERVDIIGLIVGIFLLICVAKNVKLNWKNTLKYITFFLIIMLIMIYIGEMRVDNEENITLGAMAKKVLVQNTACDIAYVFNTSIDYSKNYPPLMGKTYFTYVIELIPLLRASNRAGLILVEMYGTPGGEFILAEPVMNFGVIGIILFQIIEFCILHILLKKQGRYRFFVYSFLVMTVFRVTWYGLSYIETAMVYIIPLIYLITRMIEKTTLKLDEDENKEKKKKKYLIKVDE